MTLTCDDLRINEDPVAARAMPTPTDGSKRPIGPVQMQAKGNVRIDGQVPAQGAFSAQADRASYEQVQGRVHPGRRHAHAGHAVAAHGGRRQFAADRGAQDSLRAHRRARSKSTAFSTSRSRPSDLQNARRPQAMRVK